MGLVLYLGRTYWGRHAKGSFQFRLWGTRSSQRRPRAVGVSWRTGFVGIRWERKTVEGS